MIDRKQLLADTKAQVKKLEADLREVTAEGTELGTQLRIEYAAAFAAKRTGWSDKEWIDDRIAQASVAWVLAGVFVRFLEDNNLVAESRLAGAGSRARDAQDAKEKYFREHPADSDVDFLRWVFEQVARHPATSSVFDKQHNPLWQLPISGDAARELIEFWRRIDPNRNNALIHDFADPDLDTRFLGDLYQDLSEHAKKTYALLQTPEFVEEFILDRTLDPAIEEFGLDQATMIDPTCGSGHFLLGSFHRLLKRWREQEPGTDSRELVQRSLHAVHGVDINPFAVAIAKFRLMVAATIACRITCIADAPAFELNLAVGDSLLHGHTTSRMDLGAAGASLGTEHWYTTEDSEATRAILNRRFAAVVGNPPYITPKDKVLNQEYRERYAACKGKYALSVPFMERFFQLAIEGVSGPAGFVGKITANSFMTREFGKALVETYLPGVDLDSVVDCGGAYIPGHGTPTVIVLGRNRRPARETVRAVMGIRGEPATPADPANGDVWTSIVTGIDQPGFENDFVSVADVLRTRFARHPWSIAGGGAAELVETIEARAQRRVIDVVESVGITAFTLEDDVYLMSSDAWGRVGLPPEELRPMVLGDEIRDWRWTGRVQALFPYEADFSAISDISIHRSAYKHLWAYRTNLASSQMFGGKSKIESGLKWWEYGRLTSSKLRSRLLAFSFVATHNHFVLGPSDAIFNRSAPVVQLPAVMTAEHEMGLLGVLNSSLSAFWLKQVCHNKGSTVDARGARQRTEAFEDFYEFTGTKVGAMPLAAELPFQSAEQVKIAIDALSSATAQFSKRPPSEASRGDADGLSALLALAVASQEELDWACYCSYGFASADEHLWTGEVPEVRLGERAFEIAMVRQAAELNSPVPDWFRRHDAVPATALPTNWPEAYRALVERRISLIRSDREIRLMERPEFKRRWHGVSFAGLRREAIEQQLLAAIEEILDSSSHALTCARLSDAIGRIDGLAALLDEWSEDTDPVTAIRALVEPNAVPFASILRFTESGMARRAVWERTWDLQRAEDAIDARCDLPDEHPDRLTVEQATIEKRRTVGDIPKPPAYKQVDFSKTSYWKLRGKLDVPKERFISYQGLETSDDPSPVIGWAGWNHDQRAQALASLIDERERIQGWTGEQLVPLLAGLRELLPWLRQWHAEVDPRFGTSSADDFEALYEAKLHEHKLTESIVTSWRPPTQAQARRQKAKA